MYRESVMCKSCTVDVTLYKIETIYIVNDIVDIENFKEWPWGRDLTIIVSNL